MSQVNLNLLYLNRDEVIAMGGADMTLAVKDMENIFLLREQDDVKVPDKVSMNFGKTIAEEKTMGRINAMPGMIGGEYNMAGIKWIGSGPMNYKKGLPRASVTVILNDCDTKLPVCVADGTAVSAKRTGASGGVAMELLSRKDAAVLTICGAGAQGRTQLEAALIVRPTIKTVYVYDIRPESSERFAVEGREKYPDVTFIPVPDPEAAVRESDITVCVTLANEPIVHSEWLKKGCLLMNMADYEVSKNCVRKASKIVVDNWETIKHRLVSTVAIMAHEGEIKDEDIHAQLGEILCGKKCGRENDEEIIYFNAVGTGILDLAVTTRCYKKALEEGIGTKLAYWE